MFSFSSFAQGSPDFVFLSLGFVIAAGLFFLNHLFSFVHYLRRATNANFSISDISKLMFRPYLRIIPMHLTIIFGGVFLFLGVLNFGVLLLFMVLKTFVDVKMHLNEHGDELK